MRCIYALGDAHAAPLVLERQFRIRVYSYEFRSFHFEGK